MSSDGVDCGKVKYEKCDFKMRNEKGESLKKWERGKVGSLVAIGFEST